MRKLLKTSKKTLAIFLAMMMMLSVAIPVAFAAEPCDHNWDERATSAPTCTERGYTIYVCTLCGSVTQQDYVPANGHKYKEEDGVKTEATCTTFGGITYKCETCNESIFEIDRNKTPLGHDFSSWVIDENGHTASETVVPDVHPTVAGAYVNNRNCKRAGCDYVEYVLDNAGKKAAFYTVEFKNSLVTKNTYVAADGTVLTKDFKTEDLDKIYVAKGAAAAYTGKLPKRDATKDCGQYKFIGWATNSSTTTAADISNIQGNTVVYAKFEGVKDKILEVSFSKENGVPTTIVQKVIYGHAAQYPAPNMPTKNEDVYNTYEFAGWVRNDSMTPVDVRETPIYSSGVFFERFNAIPKEYTVVFTDWDGTVIDSYTNVVDGKTVKLYESKLEAPTDLSRPADESYAYAFAGKWKLNNGVSVNLNKFTFSKNNINDEGQIVLVADYSRQAVQYRFKLNVKDIDAETPAANGTVQILNSAGQFAGSAKLDENGEALINLTYDTKYTLQIVCNGNVKEIDVTFEEVDGLPSIVVDYGDPLLALFRRVDKDGEVIIPEIPVILQEDTVFPGGEIGDHNCICHTIFARPWVTLLNIIYRVFGRRTVCCVDMYERHADILVYTR